MRFPLGPSHFINPVYIVYKLCYQHAFSPSYIAALPLLFPHSILGLPRFTINTCLTNTKGLTVFCSVTHCMQMGMIFRLFCNSTHYEYSIETHIKYLSFFHKTAQKHFLQYVNHINQQLIPNIITFKLTFKGDYDKIDISCNQI